jgi:hypothetical protein
LRSALRDRGVPSDERQPFHTAPRQWGSQPDGGDLLRCRAERLAHTCQHVGDRALRDCQTEQSFAQFGQTLETDHLATVQIGDRSLYAGAERRALGHVGRGLGGNTMPNALLDLAEKVKAKVIGQVSEVADQVCDRMLIATSGVCHNRATRSDNRSLLFCAPPPTSLRTQRHAASAFIGLNSGPVPSRDWIKVTNSDSTAMFRAQARLVWSPAFVATVAFVPAIGSSLWDIL